MESNPEVVLMKGLGQILALFLTVIIQIFGAKIDFWMDSMLKGKVDSLDEHGIRDVNMDRDH